MSQSIICPYCQLPQQVPQDLCDPPGEVYCPNCGGPLPATPSAAARPPTVLCIDDDPLVLQFYREFLDRRGYRTLLVTDGLAGLALAAQERPAVILLDVMLRGLSGFDICRKLRADPALHDIPIILLTAWDHSSVPETGRAAGATRTLRKPADAEAIATALAEVLGQRDARNPGGSPPGPLSANTQAGP